MTIKDVQRAGEGILELRLGLVCCHSTMAFTLAHDLREMEGELIFPLLRAIANSTCQDAPAELAAEALKILEPESGNCTQR